ncbi:hypothetical protein F511_43105 [Dorcoceras hygrometricum]|uniref:Uncharacterized protein n=1 Tax=Dorcoceras hygrometricum TaxID=472368 RepID=A0A2Z6ZYP9_9LAMI|nr:hypothetical protein F511_43105 [Dorcoceras hygrometricum]
MGNCQAVDAAALVIQHPDGKLERMYWPISVNEVMKMNPGHYVSLIIPLPASGDENPAEGGGRTVRFTRVKLLRPSDTLLLGRAYRLVTTQEVMKVLRAKKHAKMKRSNQSDSGENMLMESTGSENIQAENSALENNDHQGKRVDRHRQRTGPANSTAGRSKSWRPSLQSISESAS